MNRKEDNMHTKTKASSNAESGPGAPGMGPILAALLQSLSPMAASAGHFSAARPEVLKGLREVVDGRIAQSPPVGPIMSAVLERFGLLGASHGHFNAARLELLKGLQAVLDERISQSPHQAAKAKGEKIHVL
jgi:hypothetical protein